MAMACSQHGTRDLCNIAALLWLWAVLILTTTHAAVLPEAINLSPTRNLTLPGEPRDDEIHCSNEASWTDNRRYFDFRDCFGSIYYMMHVEDTDPGRDERLETFVTHLTHLTPGQATAQKTPRKYSPCKSGIRGLRDVGHSDGNGQPGHQG